MVLILLTIPHGLEFAAAIAAIVAAIGTPAAVYIAYRQLKDTIGSQQEEIDALQTLAQQGQIQTNALTELTKAYIIQDRPRLSLGSGYNPGNGRIQQDFINNGGTAKEITLVKHSENILPNTHRSREVHSGHQFTFRAQFKPEIIDAPTTCYLTFRLISESDRMYYQKFLWENNRWTRTEVSSEMPE